MADGVVLNSGTGGSTVSTDDLGATGHVQRVKLMDGTDNSTAVIPGDAANGLDVDVTRETATAADGGSLPTVQKVVAGYDGTNTQVITTDSSGRLVVVDGGGAISVDDNGGSLTVDGTVAISGTIPVDSELTTADLDTGAGTDTRAVVGIALAASGGAVLAGAANPVPISDNAGSLTVDNVGTFPVQIAANSSVNVAQVAGTTTDTNSGVKSAGTQRVVLATDQPQLTNALKVDGSATTQPVSGTVTATGPLTDTQLRASAVPVSLASAPSTAVTNAGTFAVQDSEKVADNAAFTDGTTKVNPVGFILDEVAGTALTENDIGAGRMDSKRAQVLTLEDATTRGQRAAISAAGRLSVDASGVAVPVTDNSGSLTVDAPVGTPAFVRLSDGAAAITTLPTSLAALPALAAGSALVGRVNLDPQTANGLSIFHLVSAATTNATNIKASAGQVYGWYIYNSNAAARKLVFHNTAGTPTAGASVSFAIVIPPTSAANVEFTTGIAFATGIGITTVTDLTDAGTTAVAASDLIINVFYK